jgi:hypothetical protein
MQLQSFHNIWRILLLIGLVLSLFTPPMSSSAQDNEAQPNFMVVEYAKLYNLSYEEAERRLQLQIEMSALEGLIIDGEATYAGSWTVHEPEFGLVIAFAAEDGAEKLKPYLEGIEWANLVKVQQSPYTDEELVQILEKVTIAARDTGVPFESGANPRTAKVDIYTPEPDKLRAELEAQNKVPDYMDDIAFVYQEHLSGPLDGSDEQDPGVEDLVPVGDGNWQKIETVFIAICFHYW